MLVRVFSGKMLRWCPSRPLGSLLLWSVIGAAIFAPDAVATPPATTTISFEDPEDDLVGDVVSANTTSAPASSNGASAGAEAEDDEIIIIEDDDDDEIIIIEDDSEASDDLIIVESDDDLVVIDGDDVASDDEPLVVVEGDDDTLSLPTIQGALGGLWEAWHVAFDSDLALSAQPLDLADGPIRAIGQLHVESWILPAPNLSFFADAFARLAIDTSGQVASSVAILDVYEAYAKINLGVGAVQIGRLVLPWGRTQVAALGDVLNPIDHRRGPSFVDPVRGKQPQYGVTVRSSLGEVSFEGVALVAYEPTEGSLAASDQGGVRAARYQGALVRSPARVAGLLDGDNRSGISAATDPLQTMTLAMRARRRVGDLDIGVSVAWGMDETPSLALNPEVARFLVREAYEARGVDAANLPQNPCGGSTVVCLGPQSIFHERTGTAVVNAEWGLGIVILKSEILAQPDLSAVGVPGVRGKTTLLVTEDGLQSRGLSHYAASIAAEAGFGEWITGSLEIFDRVWLGVPAEQPLWGVEVLNETPLPERMVHRLALGTSLSGTLFDDAVAWSTRGEVGILQPDVLAHVQVRYQLPVFDLYLGARAQGYVGLVGSPGWFRQDASSIAVFVGEGR